VWIPILTLKARKNVDKEEYAVAKKKEKENGSSKLSAVSSLSIYSMESKDSDTSLGIDDDIESRSGHEIHTHLHVY